MLLGGRQTHVRPGVSPPGGVTQPRSSGQVEGLTSATDISSTTEHIVEEDRMKKNLLAVAALASLAAPAYAQTPAPGVYIGAEGGLNWLLNTNIGPLSIQPQTGWAAGGVIGYDFVGPRVELEGVYRQNSANGNFNINGNNFTTNSRNINQVGVLANLL